MTESECLALMKAPGDVRPNCAGAFHNGVIQIWVTRACDKACYGCTQASNLAGRPGLMTPEQFETACLSLKDYFGVVGMFGGNPAMHPQFEELCAIMRKHIPESRRGLWCNNLLGKGAAARATFNPAVSNLNVHLDQRAYYEFRQDWPEARPFGLHEDSRHSPVHGSMIDLGVPEAERWERISRCDINQRWSAMVGVFRGELRAWFCEVAGAQAMLFQGDPEYPDTGIDASKTHFFTVGFGHFGQLPGVEVPWWKLPMDAFTVQVRQHCHNCLVPMKGHGELAQAVGGTEQTTESYRDVFHPKKVGRPVQLVQLTAELGSPLARTTDYLQNSTR